MRRKGKWQPKLVAAVLAVGLAASPVQSSLSQAYADSKAAEAVTEEKEKPERESGSKTEETKKDTSEKVESGEGKLDEENKDTGSNSGNQTDTEEKDQSGSDGDTEGTEETEKTEENKDESSGVEGDKEETEESKEAGSTEDETEAETEESTEESSKSDSKADTEESTEVDSGESKKESAEEEDTVESSEAEGDETETKAEETEKETEETKETEEQKEAEAVELSMTVSGVKVTIHAEAGVLPEDVKLEVVKITDEEILKNLTEAAGLEDTEVIYETMALDVKLLDKAGKEVQPDTEAGELTVTFEKVAKALDTNAEEVAVYHFEDEEGTGAEEKEVKAEEDALTVEAEHFSPFLFVTKVAAEVENPVATIDGQGYATLQEAVKAAEAGSTVTLEKNTDISSTGLSIQAGQSLTLDLNGYEIKAANTRAGNIQVNGELVLEDSTDMNANGDGKGSIRATVDYDEKIVEIIDGKEIPVASYGLIAVTGADASFTLESGYINAVRDDAVNKGQYGITIQKNAEVTINGGKIEAGWFAISGNGNPGNGGTYIEINGGELVSTMDYGLYHPQEEGKVVINDGVIYGQAGGIAVNKGSIKIFDGTVTSKGIGDTGNWGDGTGNMDNAALNLAGKYGEVNVEIFGGTFIAEKNALIIKNPDNPVILQISGGIYSSEVEKEFIADGFSCIPKDGMYHVTDEKPPVDATPVKPKVTISEDAVKAPEGTSEEDQAKVQAFGTSVTEELKKNSAAVDAESSKSVVEALDDSVMTELLGEKQEGKKLEIKLNIELKSLETELAGETKDVVPKKMNFEVHPLYTVRESGTAKVKDQPLENKYLSGKTITFRLPIPSVVTESYAKVTHQGDVDYYDIEGSGTNQYIEVKATHFSEFVVEFTNSKPSSGSGSGSGGSSTTIRNNGTWHQDNVGWWFAKTGGGYPADQWYECYWNGQMKWYHFNAQGYLDAGWFTDKDGATYYLHNQHDNHFGYMYTGWNWIDGKCYYFTPNTIAGGPKQGMLYQNGVTPDGYSVNETGAWTVNGTVQTK